MARQTLEQRIRAVRVLLISFYDYLPTPVTSSGLIARSSPPGPAPGKRVPCGHCRRSGHVLSRRRRRLCPVCDGSGWRRRTGGSLPASHPDYQQPWDEYTGEPVEAEAQHPAAMSAWTRELVLERLEHEQELRLGLVDGERYGWERERQVYERKGSYQELSRALDRLADEWPAGYLHIRRVYLRGLRFEPSPTTALLCDTAEEWLAREMRGEIRIPPWLAEHVAARRQATVYELADEGMSAGQIARRLRLPKVKVQRMLRAVGTGANLGAAKVAPGASA